MKLVIGIPALNEEKRILKTLRDLPKKFDGIDKYDVVVIDDGSTDNTSEIAKKAGAIVVSHSINLGEGAAFHSAVEWTLKNKGDILVMIDADNQFNSNQIKDLIQPIIHRKADFTSGNRFFSGSKKEKYMSATKYLGNKMMSKLISLIAKQTIEDAACGFRAFSREVLLHLNVIGEFVSTQETLLDLCYKKFRLKQIPISVRYYKDRESRVAGNLFQFTLRSFLIIIKFYRDHKPLQFFGTIGFLVFQIGFFIDLFIFGYVFIHGNFGRFSTFGLLGATLNFFGILIFILGLIADMLDRSRINQEKILYLLRKQEYEANIYHTGDKS